MVAQTYAVDEVELAAEYVGRCLVVEHSYEQRDDALDDERIAVGRELQATVHVVALHPHAALAAFDDVFGSLVAFFKRFEVVAEVDEHLVFVHPVVDSVELFDYFVL